ncbi:MAG: hypothetical protein PHX40_00190 [Bacilli bacterium]|nr:hypothetical protein [Bacilli bacterium]
MFDDKLFEYLVATDQLDDVLETENIKDDEILKNKNKKNVICDLEIKSTDIKKREEIIKKAKESRKK